MWKKRVEHDDGYKWWTFERRQPGKHTPVVHEYPDGRVEYGVTGSPPAGSAKTLQEAQELAERLPR